MFCPPPTGMQLNCLLKLAPVYLPAVTNVVFDGADAVPRNEPVAGTVVYPLLKVLGNRSADLGFVWLEFGPDASDSQLRPRRLGPDIYVL